MTNGDARSRLKVALDTLAGLNVPVHLEPVVLEYLLSTPPQAAPVALRVSPSTENAPADTSDLRAFVAATKLKNAVSEIPALLYWARQHEGKETVNERDVIELYRRAGLRPPKDVAQSFRDLCKKRYFRLEPADGVHGGYRLSRVGEDFVLHDLIGKVSK